MMPKVTIWMADGSTRVEECHISMSPDDNIGEPIPYADVIDIKIDLMEF